MVHNGHECARPRKLNGKDQPSVIISRYTVYHRLTDSNFWQRKQLAYTYTTFLSTLLVISIVVCMNIANDSCTALYYACVYQYHARCLYFDLHFLLAPKGLDGFEAKHNYMT